MNYSRRQLEAFGEPLGESVTRVKPGGRIYGAGGGGGATSSTVYQNSIPKYLEPYAGPMLGATMQQTFKTDAKGNITGFKPFVPYSANPQDYVARFSPLQQQVQYNAANLQVPGQFQQGTQLANAAGRGGLESAQQAYGYGNAGYQSGMLGQQLGIQGGQRFGEMGANYGAQAAGLVPQALEYGASGAGYGAQAAGLVPQALEYGSSGAGYGAQAAGLVPQALGYGQNAADIGQMALQAQEYGRNVGEEARQFARQAAATGQGYQAQATNPYAVQAYMSPYQQNVIDLQKQAAQRDFDINLANIRSQQARSGAFGGSRGAIQEAEARRALSTQLENIQAQGLQSAYDRAMQSLQYGTGQGLQGLQAAQSGLGTALQGGQLGLSGIGQAIAGQQAGIQGVGQAGNLYGLGMQGAQTGLQGLNQAGNLYGLGMQGAQTGLQGVNQAGNLYGLGMQGAQVGLQGVDRQLAGTAQGMQGAQVGLQGVSGAQAGYGLANQAAGTLGSLGTQQLGAQTGILELQNRIGAEQQARQQAIIDNAINNYAQAQQYPQQQLSFMNAMLRGLPTESQSATNYKAAPAFGTQAATALAAVRGASGVSGRKAGGRIKESGIERLALRRALKGGKA